MRVLFVSYDVSDNVTDVVTGSVAHRELWMIRLREVILCSWRSLLIDYVAVVELSC